MMKPLLQQAPDTRSGGKIPMRRSAVLAVLMTCAALAVTSCGDGDKGPTVAEVGDSSAKASKAPETGEQGDGLKFAQCMRENGLPDFKDPQPGMGMGEGVDPGSAEFREAEAACRQYMPAPPAEGAPGGEMWSPEDKLKYAKCMRENGVPSFPDPGPDGGFRLEDDPNTPQFKKAEEACKKFQPESLRNMQPNKPGGSE